MPLGTKHEEEIVVLSSDDDSDQGLSFSSSSSSRESSEEEERSSLSDGDALSQHADEDHCEGDDDSSDEDEFEFEESPNDASMHTQPLPPKAISEEQHTFRLNRQRSTTAAPAASDSLAFLQDTPDHPVITRGGGGKSSSSSSKCLSIEIPTQIVDASDYLSPAAFPEKRPASKANPTSSSTKRKTTEGKSGVDSKKQQKTKTPADPPVVSSAKTDANSKADSTVSGSKKKSREGAKAKDAKQNAEKRQQQQTPNKKKNGQDGGHSSSGGASIAKEANDKTQKQQAGSSNRQNDENRKPRNTDSSSLANQKPVKRRKKGTSDQASASLGESTTSTTSISGASPSVRLERTATLATQAPATTQYESTEMKKKKVAAPKRVATDTAKAAKATTTATAEPPPKKKKKRRTFQDEVLHTLLVTCKPYNLKTLAQATRTTDAAVNSVMLSLVDKKLVIKKEFLPAKPGGRSKELYWANQEAAAASLGAVSTPQEMQAAKKELAELNSEHAKINGEVAAVLEEPSNEDLTKQIQEMQELTKAATDQVAQVHERIKGSSQTTNKRTNDVVGKSAQCCTSPRKLKRRINGVRDEWRKRKLKCMDFVDNMADAMEKKVKDVVKVIGIETDEMEGVQMPPKHAI